MWMACYTQEEIAEALSCGKPTVNEICSEMANLPKANKPYAEHLIDFDILIHYPFQIINLLIWEPQKVYPFFYLLFLLEFQL